MLFIYARKTVGCIHLSINYQITPIFYNVQHFLFNYGNQFCFRLTKAKPSPQQQSALVSLIIED